MAVLKPLLPECFAKAVVAQGVALDFVRRAAKHAEDIPVPAVEQQTGWTCGPASLKAVARLYGRDVGGEPAYIALCHATPEDGTPPERLVRAARALGLVCEPREGMSLAELEREIILGHPVVICFQAWGSPEWYAVDESGHWAVVKGRDATTIHLEDPADDSGEPVKVSKQDLLRRWHDKSGDGRRFVRFGIVFKGLAEGQATA